VQTTLSYFHATFGSCLRGHLQLHSTVPPRPSASETGRLGMRNIGSHLQQTLCRPAEPHSCSDNRRPSFNESSAAAHSPIHTFDSEISHQVSQSLPEIPAAVIRKEVFSSHTDYKCKCLLQFNYLPNCFLYL